MNWLGYGVMLPVLPERGRPEGIALRCNSQGYPIEFQYHLERDTAAAFVTLRTDGQPPISAEDKALNTPLRLLVPFVYPGLSVLGEEPVESPGDSGLTFWPWLVLAKSDAMPK